MYMWRNFRTKINSDINTGSSIAKNEKNITQINTKYVEKERILKDFYR